MEIQKIFSEIGRLHLENMQLQEQIAQLQKRIQELTPAVAPPEPKSE